MRQPHLEVLDLEDAARWRWRLTTERGALLAQHSVDVEVGSAGFEAFSDLHRYLRVHAAPDRLLASETELLEWVGRWIGDEV